MKNMHSGKAGLGKPLIVSVILHLILIGFLVFGGNFMKEKPKPTGSMVQAVVIDPNLVRQQAKQMQHQRQAAAKKERERLEKLRQESERLEKNRQQEEARIKALQEKKAREELAAKKAEQRRQQKERQKKLAEEKAAKAEAARKEKEAALARAEKIRVEKEKVAKAAAEKARLEKAAAKKAEQQRIAKEKAAKEAAEKARKEKERLRQLEKERKEQEAALDDIFSGLASESKQNQSAMNKAIASEMDRYGAIYTQLIQQNLRLDESFKGKSCQVNLNLIPTGAGAIAGNVKVLGGSQAVCAATLSAIAQVSSFPLPKDPKVVDELKHINLTVEPE